MVKAACPLGRPDEEQEESGAKLTDRWLNGNIDDLSLQLTGFQSVLHDMIIAH